jgi:arginyl-tRNA synthetase
VSFDPLADFDAEIRAFLSSAGVDPTDLHLDTPPQRELGERATNVALRLAKERRRAPREIAGEIAGRFDPDAYRFIANVDVAGAGFINFHLDYAAWVPHAISAIRAAGSTYGRRPDVQEQRVVVEHTSVNPNKDWHIGHVRNAVLGDIVARVLKHAGHDVQVQNYIDDTGLQAATSILGLTKFPEPEVAGEKFDQYAGRPYVKISAELAEKKLLQTRLKEVVPELSSTTGNETAALERERVSIEARLQNIQNLETDIMQTMRALEHGEYRPLIDRILQGQLQTAFRLGIFYDLLNWESDLVASHTFQQAMEVLRESPRVFKAEEGRYAGAVVIQTGAEDSDKAEVLIRSNGIPTYVAKDIAYHMWKFGVLPERLGRVAYLEQPNGKTLWSTALHGERIRERTPDRVINIIAVDQSQAQATVKEALRVAGYPQEADDLFHLAYGLVTTKEGRISGRKGTTAAGDTVIDEAVQTAHDRVRERDEGLPEEQVQATAEAVGIGAVRYFMAQYNPLRNIEFDVADVVSYDGNTALYIQYALVRMFAILRRARSDAGVSDAEIDAADVSLLGHEQERRLVFHLGLYPQTVTDVTRTLAANLVAEYAYDLATIFSQFYRDCGVLNADPPLRAARLLLVRTVRDVLTNACDLLGVPVIERL